MVKITVGISNRTHEILGMISSELCSQRRDSPGEAELEAG